MVNSIESKQLIYAMGRKIKKKEYGPEKIILFGSYAWVSQRRTVMWIYL